MFTIIKFIIWIAGIALIIYLALPYFGYEVNMKYFTESQAACQKRLTECGTQLVQQGTNNAKCDFDCVNPTLIIKKN